MPPVDYSKVGSPGFAMVPSESLGLNVCLAKLEF